MSRIPSYGFIRGNFLYKENHSLSEWLRLSENYDTQLCDRAARDGPGQLLLPFGQFTFRVKGAKSPLRVQSSSYLSFLSLNN